MSAPGVALATDGDLIRSIHDRLRVVEDTTTSRVGEWVFSSVDGVLQAVKPGATPVVFGAAPDLSTDIQKAVTAAIGKGGYVSASDLAKSLSGLTGVDTSSPDALLEQIKNWTASLLPLSQLSQALLGIPGDLADIATWALSIPTLIGGVLSQTVTGWADALHSIGVPTPDQFMAKLQGLIPAAERGIDGAVHQVIDGATGLVNNLNGTWSWIASEAETATAQLIQQADGTIVSAAQLVQHAAAAASQAGVPLVQALTAGQHAVDQGIAAITGELVQAGQPAIQFAQSIGGFITGLFNNWTGSNVANAAAPQIDAAALAAAQAAAAQAALTAQINGQLPHFYGASGAAGGASHQDFTGLTSLPVGWTQVTTPIAVSTAKYNIPVTTDSQTVAGIFSSTDALAKYLILRASYDFTYLVYAKIQNNEPFTGNPKCEIGYLKAGVKTSLGTIILPSPGTLQANNSYSLTATAYTFTLTGPGGLSFAVTDSLNDSLKGPLYVYGGFGTDGTSLGTSALTTPVWPSTASWSVPAGMQAGDKLAYALYAGGSGGSGAVSAGSLGSPGTPGDSVAGSLTFGPQIPLTTTTITGTIGLGGAGGAAGGGAGTNGSYSGLSIPGYGSFSVSAHAGGAGGGGGSGSGGIGASNLIDNNIGYTGGYGGISWPSFPGGVPGGAGAGGTFIFGGASPGSAGGQGEIFLTPISTALPGSMLSWVFYDSGPTAGPSTAYVGTQETTPSSTYADLPTATDQVTVTIGSSGLALVFINCYQSYTTLNNGQTSVSFAVSGATSIAAGPPYESSQQNANSGGIITTGALAGAFIVSNLNAGANTFKLKYKTSGGTANFIGRSISVTPL